MAVKLIEERVQRHSDECACDWCGAPNYVGDRVFLDMEREAAYCSWWCAAQDHFDRGYGPTSGGTVHDGCRD